ncbi:hypothetical protein [Wolbachia endosymbiont (group A) of Aleiodes leptofemur]|uniref:hypothetical protein n=1 Tax=Wolbachia endosymbiont (group A) of Aleiodes leptofemur TaxID=3077919 RepID=UPI00333E708F
MEKKAKEAPWLTSSDTGFHPKWYHSSVKHWNDTILDGNQCQALERQRRAVSATWMTPFFYLVWVIQEVYCIAIADRILLIAYLFKF